MNKRNLPLSPRRIISDMDMSGSLMDNMNGFLDRAAAIAAMIDNTDPRNDGRDRHPIQDAAQALWLEIQDAKTFLQAYDHQQHLELRAAAKEAA